MARIKEDYVSFETAKLLKEKGFEGYGILTIYDEDAANAYIKELQEKHLPYNSDAPKLKEFYYTQPTLQMAMKWLREVHNIFIDIRFNRTYQRYKYFVFFMGTNDDDMYDHTNLSKKESYEETVESALRYCLENLI